MATDDHLFDILVAECRCLRPHTMTMTVVCDLLPPIFIISLVYSRDKQDEMRLESLKLHTDIFIFIFSSLNDEDCIKKKVEHENCICTLCLDDIFFFGGRWRFIEPHKKI